MPNYATYPHRRKYDSFIVWLYAENKEGLLPTEFRESIPDSTASTWRHIDYNGYYGSEFRHIQQQSLEYYELFLRYKNLQRVVGVIAKTWVMVADVVKPVLMKEKSNTEKLLDGVQLLMGVLPKKTALKIMGLTPSAFRYRMDELHKKCGLSPLQLCLRSNPLQLSRIEIDQMKVLLQDKKFVCWSLSSIAWWSKREKWVMASLSTWYKYAPMLGWKRQKFSPEKAQGVKSSRPNEYLHADTTYYKLESGQKVAAVLVSDNFSKAVLGKVTAQSNGAVNVVEALKNAVGVMRFHHPDLVTASLITDGGSENHAVEVEQCLEKIAPPIISKYIALKDVSFSNSPVEAINKILKRYLRHYKPKTYEQFEEVVDTAINEYNYPSWFSGWVNPHGSLQSKHPQHGF